MNIEWYHMVAGYVGYLLGLGYVGVTFGGYAWIPFGIFVTPLCIVAAGYLYATVTGKGTDMDFQQAMIEAQDYANRGDDE